MFIDAVSQAMEEHSYDIIWFFDFDEQDTVLFIEDTGCYPEDGPGYSGLNLCHQGFYSV